MDIRFTYIVSRNKTPRVNIPRFFTKYFRGATRKVSWAIIFCKYCSFVQKVSLSFQLVIHNYTLILSVFMAISHCALFGSRIISPYKLVRLYERLRGHNSIIMRLKISQSSTIYHLHLFFLLKVHPEHAHVPSP